MPINPMDGEAVREPDFICDSCATGFHDDAQGHRNYDTWELGNGDTVCSNCYDETYHCYECNQNYHTDDYNHRTELCHDCHDERTNTLPDTDHRGLYQNNFDRPSDMFKFMGDSKEKFKLIRKTKEVKIMTNRYFGLEIELYIKRPHGWEVLKELLTELNSEQELLWVAKHDGSLSDMGFELESLPCTQEYHQKALAIIERFAKAGKIYGHNGNNNGLHIHVSNDFSLLMQNKMNLFMNHPEMKSILQKIAQRDLGNYCSQHSLNAGNKRILNMYSRTNGYDVASRHRQVAELTQVQSELTELLNNPANLQAIINGDISVHGYEIHRKCFLPPTQENNSRGALAPRQEMGTLEFRLFKANCRVERINKNMEFIESVAAFLETVSIYDMWMIVPRRSIGDNSPLRPGITRSRHYSTDNQRYWMSGIDAKYLEFMKANHFLFPNLARFMVEKSLLNINFKETRDAQIAAQCRSIGLVNENKAKRGQLLRREIIDGVAHIRYMHPYAGTVDVTEMDGNSVHSSFVEWFEANKHKYANGQVYNIVGINGKASKIYYWNNENLHMEKASDGDLPAICKEWLASLPETARAALPKYNGYDPTIANSTASRRFNRPVANIGSRREEAYIIETMTNNVLEAISSWNTPIEELELVGADL